MSRARDLADSGSKANFLDNVSADINTTYAPKASPDFTGTVDLTGTTLSLDNDQISGDKVAGGVIGAGTTFNGTIGSSATFATTPYIISAYVTFNANDSGENAAQQILDSLNVTSVTRYGLSTGLFRVNLSITMANTKYVIIGSANGSGSNSAIAQYDSGVQGITTTTFGIRCVDINGVNKDVSYTNIIVIGDR